jgi:large subunit ribosomal protein L13
VKLGDYVTQAPDQLIELAVRRMLPKNRLARRMISRLKVYRGAAHPHMAQKPTPAVKSPGSKSAGSK